ncbi:hypothetical protein ATE68_10515 [Sphingopyxis sp. H038]|uniref:hypothetical protein n=1 Tax=unclassified Sphingopyxis TaxID=2614943 RepID=UPI0007305FA0|nr:MULTISPECIES: hypothetical protein [unclassified Sphingopyxis]KTE01487.1 hypothetical protein ATE78_14965 [Sphingopyxis sp. H012]KTE07020.1 hypothetical protein ATE76_18080 [Sphingopyxis sp. H093]KTE12589.1 hypothetical protein ATE70_04825 [Sphingopyxis sp. H053]KTE26746.1 hypothetical protein ATE75_14540 [Sphingopyxis sp. H080]KTE34779.1 hypothetical protein ATE68_10515 [Sphingopyxis sp. H038]
MIDPHEIVVPTDPDEALAAVVALRRLADHIEREAVHSALHQGWSWSRIAQALGISKQAAHKRLSDVAANHGSA